VDRLGKSVEFLARSAMLFGTCGERLFEPGVENFRSDLGARGSVVWRDHVRGATTV